MLRVLFIGDVFGAPGRRILSQQLPKLRPAYDFVIVNGENAAGGFGLNRESFAAIIQAGADCVTLGNHAWHHREVYGLLDDPRLVRPFNLPAGTPGAGVRTFEARNAQGQSEKITVVNALGRVFMEAVHNPFLALDELLAAGDLGHIFVDFHAEATSEKAALGWHLDGRVATVIGTHTHVPTADSRILPRGTGFQTDAGFTGPMNSIIGSAPEGPIGRFLTERHQRFGVQEGPAELNGVALELENNKCLKIERVHLEEES